jgi:hypothetical protein
MKNTQAITIERVIEIMPATTTIEIPIPQTIIHKLSNQNAKPLNIGESFQIEIAPRLEN